MNRVRIPACQRAILAAVATAILLGIGTAARATQASSAIVEALVAAALGQPPPRPPTAHPTAPILDDYAPSAAMRDCGL